MGQADIRVSRPKETERRVLRKSWPLQTDPRVAAIQWKSLIQGSLVLQDHLGLACCGCLGAVWVLKDSWMVSISGVEVGWDKGQKGKLKSLGETLYLGCVMTKTQKKKTPFYARYLIAVCLWPQSLEGKFPVNPDSVIPTQKWIAVAICLVVMWQFCFVLASVTCLCRHSRTILRLPWLPNLSRAEQLLACLCKCSRPSCGFCP